MSEVVWWEVWWVKGDQRMRCQGYGGGMPDERMHKDSFATRIGTLNLMRARKNKYDRLVKVTRRTKPRTSEA